MSLTGIKAAIVTALDGSTLLTRAYSQIPETINELPCAYVLPRSGTFHMDAGSNMTHKLEVIVLVKRVGDIEEGQESLDAFLDSTAFCATIEATDLGVHGHTVLVTGYRDYGGMEFAGVQYLGLRFDVTVIA